MSGKTGYSLVSISRAHLRVLCVSIIVLVVVLKPAVDACAQGRARELKLVPHRISLANGKSFDLNLPEQYGISVAAQGLKRVRFMAKSPDERIFVTDMYNLTDNSRGVVYILEEFNPESASFKKVTPYLKGLRNPNSIAFYRDTEGVDWFYLALTDRLLRYKYFRITD